MPSPVHLYRWGKKLSTVHISIQSLRGTVARSVQRLGGAQVFGIFRREVETFIKRTKRIDPVLNKFAASVPTVKAYSPAYLSVELRCQPGARVFRTGYCFTLP